MVLARLNVLVKEFVKIVGRQRNLPEAVVDDAGGKIFTFGSYRLGVHEAGADIDTLCVVPRFVQRDDFFTTFYEMLKSRPDVTELKGVPEAYVPVIKMEVDAIPIDLLFARLNLPSIPEDLTLSSDQLLKNLDDKDVRSLNGSRVTDEILRLVPSVPTFRSTLRCIKLWAKSNHLVSHLLFHVRVERAVYGNVMGFPGGVAWAMMTARVCQLYPNATPSLMVNKFFKILSQWNWPSPILLKKIEDGSLSLRVWNPRVSIVLCFVV
jgi:poly(A) polymerase